MASFIGRENLQEMKDTKLQENLHHTIIIKKKEKKKDKY